MKTYLINLIDSDLAPDWRNLCTSMRDPRQEGEECRWTVATESPAELEAALEADEAVTWYEQVEEHWVCSCSKCLEWRREAAEFARISSIHAWLDGASSRVG